MTTRATPRRPYSKSWVARTMGMKLDKAIEFLKRHAPHCVIEPPGRNARTKIDADAFDRWWHSRRCSELDRRRQLDEDWVEHKLSEEFPS